MNQTEIYQEFDAIATEIESPVVQTLWNRERNSLFDGYADITSSAYDNLYLICAVLTGDIVTRICDFLNAWVDYYNKRKENHD